MDAKSMNSLRGTRACAESVIWAETQDSLESAWNNCERGDWLLWVAARAGVDRKLVVMAACQCARASLKYVKDGDKRPVIAIETTEAWTRGEATIDQVRNAAYDAYAANAAAYAAYVAVADAHSAAATADAAADCAAAADAAYAAATTAADAADARRRSLKESADLVRSVISVSDFPKGTFS